MTARFAWVSMLVAAATGLAVLLAGLAFLPTPTWESFEPVATVLGGHAPVRRAGRSAGGARGRARARAHGEGGRPADRPGLDQPAGQRGQVHPAGWAHPGRCGTRVERLGRVLGRRHGGRYPARSARPRLRALLQDGPVPDGRGHRPRARDLQAPGAGPRRGDLGRQRAGTVKGTLLQKRGHLDLFYRERCTRSWKWKPDRTSRRCTRRRTSAVTRSPRRSTSGICRSTS